MGFEYSQKSGNPPITEYHVQVLCPSTLIVCVPCIYEHKVTQSHIIRFASIPITHTSTLVLASPEIRGNRTVFQRAAYNPSRQQLCHRQVESSTPPARGPAYWPNFVEIILSNHTESPPTPPPPNPRNRGRTFTSANQVLRKVFNLYANIRPAKSVVGVPTPFPQTDLGTAPTRSHPSLYL